MIRLSDLKQFQLRAAHRLSEMVQCYPNDEFRARYDQDTGERLPFLCRLSAITGSGKTPILALTAQYLKNGIILWTTNRSAVISQTITNLRAGGKYSQLLREGTQVFALGDMSPSDWEDTMVRKDGLTILLSTVAAFNQEGDKLKIHQRIGNETRWEMLSSQGVTGRKRTLYVMYDEGHGVTERQFRKLRELRPHSFILASASDLPEDLSDLLPGNSKEDVELSLRKRTVAIPTKEVVEEGLLKTRLYLVDCDVAQEDAVKTANDKWRELAGKLEQHRKIPIACFIVNNTERGVIIGEELLKLGVPAQRIAVHLNNAREVATDRGGLAESLIDTYSGRQAESRSPESLARTGYTHIIWNLTLREGWDEPFAYVAYIDGKGRSQTDMVQKIGRFVRQPGATPFADPDLNSAYFYFNVSDEEFQDLLRDIQLKMETEGYEIIPFNRGRTPPNSRKSEARTPKKLTNMSPWFGPSLEDLDRILLDQVPIFGESSLQSEGEIKTAVFDMRTQSEDENQRTSINLMGNDVVTPWEFLSARLGAMDSRIIGTDGTIFSSQLQSEEKMRQPIQRGSDAARHLETQVEIIKNNLNDKLSIKAAGRHGMYTVPPFNLTSPDAESGSLSYQRRCRVHTFEYSIHKEYNGLNPFELEVARALDRLSNSWARNPSRGQGYKIPINELGAKNNWFYPDFLLWSRKNLVWAIDPKGEHLAEPAIAHKLLDLSNVSGLSPKVQIAFLLEGHFNIEGQWLISKAGTGGYTLIRKVGAAARAVHNDNINRLIESLK